MPSNHDFICQYCGWTTVQPANNCAHICPKNKTEGLTELIRLDDPASVAIDICCDGCEAERLGVEHHVYTPAVAKASAIAAGWACERKRDWCPRCAADKKVAAS